MVVRKEGVADLVGGDVPLLTASMAYSTWKTCPSGLEKSQRAVQNAAEIVLIPEYCRLVRFIWSSHWEAHRTKVLSYLTWKSSVISGHYGRQKNSENREKSGWTKPNGMRTRYLLWRAIRGIQIVECWDGEPSWAMTDGGGRESRGCLQTSRAPL